MVRDADIDDPTLHGSDHEWEDRLEPRHLINRCDVILRVGAAMLASGTGARRVAETMHRVAAALDIDDIQTQIALTELSLTVHRRGITRTQTIEIPSPGVNADQIAALLAFSRQLPQHVTVREVDEGLDRILARPKQWPSWAGPVGAGAACAAFAYLNHGRPDELIAVFLAAICGQTLRRALHRRSLNQLAMAFLAAGLATIVYLGLITGIRAITGQAGALGDAGLLSSTLFLVPGFPLMTAALDLARLDLLAGITRMTYATLLTCAAGLGLWAVLETVGVSAAPSPPQSLPLAASLGLQMLASFVGVFGFAVVFNSPPLVAAATAGIALLANPLRLMLVQHLDVPAQNAAAAATLLVGLLAWVVGKVGGLPRIILSVPSVVIMVPGAAAFRALVRFNEGDLTQAATEGISTVITIGGMAAGLVASRMLTDPLWAFSTPNPPTYASVARRLAPYVPRTRQRQAVSDRDRARANDRAHRAADAHPGEG